MRNESYLVQQLRLWGVAQANRYALTRADRSTHALEKARDMAPGTRENALRDLVGRDGTDRRKMMAARTGVMGLSILPTWAVDPIRSTNDAGHPQDNEEIPVDMGIPDELRWIDRALSSLARQYLLRAIIVRTEYTVSASQRIKAKMACDLFVEEMARRMGISPPPQGDSGRDALTPRQYRHELAAALTWLDGAHQKAA